MPDTRSGGRENAGIGGAQAFPVTADQESIGGAPEGRSSEGGAREQVRQARDKVVEQAKSTFRDARDAAGSSLSDGRRRAAEQIGGIGSALHRTGDQLRGEDKAGVADLADSFGRRIDRVAEYLRDSDGRTITRDLESLARRQPALVFAGAFALGIVAARFLKSSTPEAEYRASDSYDSYDSGYGRIRPGGEPAGLGGEVERGGFDAPA